MKAWHWFVIGFLVAAAAAFFTCRYYSPCAHNNVTNDSLVAAHNKTIEMANEVDSLIKNDSLSAIKTDSFINQKYESKKNIFLNNNLDSLYRERKGIIRRLDSRKCPY